MMPRLFLSEIPNAAVSGMELPEARQRLENERISLWQTSYRTLLEPSVDEEPVPLLLSNMEIPPGVDLEKNIQEAKKKRLADIFFGKLWFRKQVQNGGPWDYKQQGRIYQDFGNFHYGVVGRAMGFNANFLLQQAGGAQKRDKNTNPEWGRPGFLYNPFGGTGSYGDDPHDQEMIKKGIEYYDKFLSKSHK